MFGCKCCRCSNSIESLDLSKPHTEVISKREKLTEAEAKSYKKLRLSSFIPESYFVNGQQMNCASTSQIDCSNNEHTKVKKIHPLTGSPTNSSQETKPKLAFQAPIFEEENVNEAETLIGPSNRVVDRIDRETKRKKSTEFEKLEIANPIDSSNGTNYNFDYNLYSIKKNISVWCIDIALLTSNGQMLKNILNKGSHHLAFLFDRQSIVNNDPTVFDEMTTTTVNHFSQPTHNGTSLSDEERKKFNELWSSYLIFFNLGLICSSILLQLLVGILLLMNTKSSKKRGASFPRRSGECYNHLILIIILFINILNVFIVIFVDEGT